MIISVLSFYNIAALLHIAMLVLVVVFIVTQIVLFFAKLRILREVNGLKAGLKKALADAEGEDPHRHMETHAHEAGEALAKGDLVIARDGLLMKANRENYAEMPVGMKMEHVELSKAPAAVQEMAAKLEAEMRGEGKKGHVVAIRIGNNGAGGRQSRAEVEVVPAPRKRTAPKKVAKKVTKRK